MPGRREPLTPGDLEALAAPVLTALDAGLTPDREALKRLVRELALQLATSHPGRTVEVRVPPYTAVQCLAGPKHTRGTPANVVEVDAVAWVELCAGRVGWQDLVRTGRLRASGERADLSALFPLLPGVV